MKQNLASSPAKKWNRKNQPSSIERFGERSNGVKGALRKLPSAAASMMGKRQGLMVASMLAITAIGLFWYFSQED